jgi:MGT family glycosyltransferase
MARVLAYTTPARGHLFPVIPILDELRGRGHEIALRTLASEVVPMQARGFDAASIDAAVERIEHDDFLARTPLGAQKRAVHVACRRAELDAEDLRRAIDDVRPDVLLVDVNAWGALAAAEAWGGAWASWCPYPLPVPSRDAPPFGPGFRPARGRPGRLRDAALGPIVFGSLERILRPRVNELRARVGVPPLSRAADLFLAAPLLLYLTAEPFEYPRSDWPASVRLVGPCDWDPPAAPPAWLEAVEAPIVLVTTSSEFQDDGRLVRCALEALADESVHVVATLPASDPASFASPADARVLRFVAHGPILDRAACAITHGGMGATQKALARGVPVCAVPFGRDQFEVARRVEVAGAGARLPARRLSPKRLRAAVKKAIRCQTGARRIADSYRQAGGPVAAADALEELIRSPATAPNGSEATAPSTHAPAPRPKRYRW